MVNALCFPNDYPVFEMGKVVTKEEEITYLDDLGLFADCWYCRTPRADRPCRKCENANRLGFGRVENSAGEPPGVRGTCAILSGAYLVRL